MTERYTASSVKMALEKMKPNIDDDRRDGYIYADNETLKWLIGVKKAINRADLVLVQP